MATIKEIKEQLASIQRLDDPLLTELEQDSRSGVIQAIAKRKREIQKRLDEDERLEGMLAYAMLVGWSSLQEWMKWDVAH